MVLEPPARVKPFCAVLENPSFSLMGILLRIASGTGVSVPITSTVLIYYHFHPEDTKFHLYLIPSDSLLMKVRLADFGEDMRITLSAYHLRHSVSILNRKVNARLSLIEA